jgi:hypothetical protein
MLLIVQKIIAHASQSPITPHIRHSQQPYHEKSLSSPIIAAGYHIYISTMMGGTILHDLALIQN